MKEKEFYLEVDVPKTIDNHQLACCIETLFDVIDCPLGGYTDTFEGKIDDRQLLYFSITVKSGEEDKAEEVKKLIERYLTNREIDHAVEVSFQRDL